MSEPENFLARWSRLKRDAAAEVNSAGEHAPVAALQAADAPTTPAFDPASLPPIASIDAATDIRPFLNVCVPEELTRAALRSTWSADPAIRDFIGIAESQWDFNDPASIPGFGAHVAADYVFGLAAHTVGSLSTVVETESANASHDADVVTAAEDLSAAVSFTQPNTSEGELETPPTRAHGSALPR